MKKVMLFITGISQAQQVNFISVLGGTNYDRAFSVVQTPDNGYALSGHAISFGYGSIVSRFDSLGNHIWSRMIEGGPNDWGSYMTLASDGGFAVTAYTSLWGAGNRDILIAKLDPNGNLLWAKTIGGTNADEAGGIIKTADNGFAIVGSSWSFGPSTFSSLIVVKLDSAGNHQWTRCIGLSGQAAEGRGIAATPDSGVVAVGSITGVGAGGWETLICRFDKSGNLLWNRTIGGPNDDYIFPNVTRTSDDGFVVGCRTDSWGVGNGDAMISRFDASGNQIWTRVLGAAGADYVRGIVQTSDGNLTAAGYLWNTSTSTWDAWLFRYDLSGNHIWSKKVFGPTGGSNGNSLILTSDGGSVWSDDWGYGCWDGAIYKPDQNSNIEWARAFGSSNHDGLWRIRQTSDGGYILGGYTRYFGSNPWNFFVVKLSSSGATEWIKTYDFGSYQEGVVDIAQMPDGGYIFTGEMNTGSPYVVILRTNAVGDPIWAKYLSATNVYGSTSVDGDNLIVTGSFSGLSDDIFIIKIDGGGNLLWVKKLGGANSDISLSISITDDGGFAVLGYSNSYASSYDLLVLKVNASQDYAGCIMDWQQATLTNIPVVDENVNTGKSYTPYVVTIAPSMTSVSLSTLSICSPMDYYQDDPYNHPGGITCIPVSGGLIFASEKESLLRLYLPDGRLFFSGLLGPSQTRIPLDPGVYLWQAGPYKGKAVVR
ncbi:MAG: hypothetical protein ABIM74_00845 [candidate division WOR-3 bacterium]